jgi:hypothetical protein
VTPSTACRECDWSALELLYRLQNGLPYETVPPGHVIDWNNSNVKDSFDVAAGTVTFVQEIVGGGGVGPHTVTVAVKIILLPVKAEAPPAGDAPAPQRLLDPKELFDELREANPRGRRERPTDYADRLHKLMKAQSHRVRFVWDLETVRRALYPRKSRESRKP